MNLLKLARYAQRGRGGGGDAHERRSSPSCRGVERTATGRTLHIPAEAGYGVTEFAVAMPTPKR